ncbi:hypothetical protein AB0F18_02635 [Streptomyces sp. NPDC029216]|uniref:hypothetical protein n=1 Tax=Streptomyces sp. NPDC029216 TaxID=3154701 RepID=UPI0033CB0B24
MDAPGGLDEDEALAELCRGMAPGLRRHAAALALWRLRAPLLMLPPDPRQGLHRTLLEAVFRAVLLTPGEEAGRAGEDADAVAELLGTPFFTDPEEGEPDGALAEVRLETLAELAAWRNAGGLGPEETERIIRLPRELSRTLDRITEDSPWDHPAAHAHARHLATAPAGSGYHEARNRAVEAACRDLTAALPPGAGLPGTAAGREALALCETFSAELVSTLAWCTTIGR